MLFITQKTLTMNRIILMALLLVMLASCHRAAVPSTTAYSNTEVKNANSQNMLLGHCGISMLRSNNYKDWYNQSYNSYVIDTNYIAQLKPLLKSKTIEIFLGTWCGDSKREVPRMLKILASANVDTSAIKLIFVNNTTVSYKQSPQHEEANKNIHHVPTFIFYDGKKDIGRIVESPVVTLEKDMAAILQKAAYAPNYKAISYWQKAVKQKGKNMTDVALQEVADSVKILCKHSGELNAYGYMLLAQNNVNEAINIFKLNTLLYPEKASVYDSLAEAYYTIGNKAEAKKYYEKVLAISPSDNNAKKILETLK
jgi:tetratricopeptide (TPR) repeat protein